MTLIKLLIVPEIGLPVVAMFNPQQITMAKAVNWYRFPVYQRNTPPMQFIHGQPTSLSLELFFDTYESKLDVRLITGLVENLTQVQGPLHRPPVCRLIWGTAGVFFKGVLANLSQTFTLFLPTGNPVRASLSCTFVEWRSDAEDALKMNLQSPDVAKSRVVRLGETLSSIAAEEYNDPGLWRVIARANKIVNPLRLHPGTVLSIPVLDAGEAGAGLEPSL